VLDASAYGAPTRRRRLFLIARRDGKAIIWPSPTHGPGLAPLRTAAECIDWSIPCPSIFERKRPLAEKTLWRIAQGLRRFVLDNPDPFLVKVNHGGRDARVESIADPMTTVTASRRGHAVVTPVMVTIDHGSAPRGASDAAAPLPTTTTENRHAVAAATLCQVGYGERPGQAARVPGLDKPLGTVVAGGQKHALVSAYLLKHFGGVVGQQLRLPAATITAVDHHAVAAATLVKLRGECAGADLRDPAPTITAGGNHLAEVRAYLTAFYSSDGTAGKGQDLRDPLRTITAKHRLGLVTIRGVDYQVVDIGMRMLEPHELLAAQFGRFAPAYDLSAAKTKSAKVRLIGNSVCPEIAEALVRANLPNLAARAEVA
jgi:DNA (cytosine-5)-methyltransferase 1